MTWLKDLKQVERILLLLSTGSIVLFTAGYYIRPLFYITLFLLAVFLVVWIGFWRCPHCGRQLWFNFDAPCKHCHMDIFEKDSSH